MPTKPTKKAVAASRTVPSGQDITSAIIGDSPEVANAMESAGVITDVQRDASGRATAFAFAPGVTSRDVGTVVTAYSPDRNPFLNALVNRIAFTIIKNRTFDNPWAVFKKGYMEFGETVEEVFVDICEPHMYSPENAEQKVFKREIPDVRAAFHTMNWQVFYKQTVSNDQLRMAFLSWQGISDLVSKIVTAMVTSMNVDELYMMKYLIARAILDGNMYVQVIEDPDTDAKAALKTIQTATLNMKWPSRDYNQAGVMNFTPIEDQRLIETNAARATLNVDALAEIFQLAKADYLQIQMDVDDFSKIDFERIKAMFTDPVTGEVTQNVEEFDAGEKALLASVVGVLTTVDWWMIFDNFSNMTQNYNGEGLYWNYWLHGWKTFSYSPFENCIVFSKTAQSITGVTVSPNTASVDKGQSVVLTATVAGTGIVNTNVTWKVAGASELASGTHIDGGTLYVAKDETNTTLTVTATSAQDSSKSGTATITVNA